MKTMPNQCGNSRDLFSVAPLLVRAIAYGAIVAGFFLRRPREGGDPWLPQARWWDGFPLSRE
jgi:hypothetical protein